MVTFAQPEPEREHPVIAWLAVAAIVLASLLIAWARVEVHGTGDLEAALYEEPEVTVPSEDARAVDEAVAAGRWVSTF